MSPAKLTTKEFIRRAKEVHGDKYDYSEAVYTYALEKIKIICPEHGAWMQTASTHMAGRGCNECGKLSRAKAQTSDTNTFINKSKVIHGTKYDYSKVTYVNNREKVEIICPKHGEFFQSPSKHLGGNGCIKCGFEKVWNRDDLQSFLRKAKSLHGNKFDYSQVMYTRSIDKVIIICAKHGEFTQTPSSHLQGAGCDKCSRENPGNKLDTKRFIKRSMELHGDKFDYSKTIYSDIKSSITLICPIHGKFSTNADNHLASLTSGGCKKCKYESSSKANSLSLKEFKSKANKIWNKQYDYSKVNYVNGHTKVTIACKKHGDFIQSPSSHLNGHGCPKCVYKGEARIAEYLHKKLIVYREYKIRNKRYDFYLPEHNLIIERDGQQHYRDTSNFSSYIKKDPEIYLKEQFKNDTLKTKLAKDAGFKIARIPYWLTKEEEEIEIENILAGKPTYPDVPDLKQEKTKPKPKKHF